MTIGQALADRGNGLNALRLVFAIAVITSHAWPLAGHQFEPGYAGVTLGAWSVAGFFAISGYLIPQSRLNTTLLVFMLRRARRIFPALWACLLLTAFVASPIGAALAGTPYQPLRALTYVAGNLTTKVSQWTIGAETAALPFTEWNGPLWTLWSEVCCYLLVGALLSSTVLRRHGTAIAAPCLMALAAMAIRRDLIEGLLFSVFFAAGWLIATRRQHLILSPARTVLAVAVALAAAQLHPALAALPVAYAVLSIGGQLQVPWLARHDISYGTYLYGWPLQQLLLLAGAGAAGVGAFLVASVLLALTAGAASWFLVERHFLPAHRPAQHAPQPLRSDTPVGAHTT